MNMFEKPGQKLQGIAMMLFGCLLLASLILAFVFGFERNWGRTEFRAGLFFGILIGGAAYAYLMSLSLFAFGRLVDNTDTIRSVLKTDEERKGLESAHQFFNRSSQNAVLSNNIKKYKTCPNCGEENPSSEMFCHQCGAKL
ncbi:MAG: zinc-ribbon domain-containing protein [Oscillospiraceae bacterium]|nr:zinc-ribbon domain-containing protein [Oscillospiraceae bacterium]